MLMISRAWARPGLVALLAAAVFAAGCRGDQTSPSAPSTVVPPALLGANPDGSTLKVTPPAVQSPTNLQQLDDLTPVFRFTNAQALHVSVPLQHEVELLTEGGQRIGMMAVTTGAGQSAHTYPGNLEMNTVYQWRVRATYGGHVGPWSNVGAFRTRAIPLVTPETLNDYLFAFSFGNPDWAACTNAGNGTACFRFVYDLAQSINPTCDPNSWGLLSKNPGEWQCTRSGCGNFGGEGFGEDIITHGGWNPILLWDVIIGAGAPGSILAAVPIPRHDRRPGNNWACPWR
jgi:hypothetical protein